MHAPPLPGSEHPRDGSNECGQVSRYHHHDSSLTRGAGGHRAARGRAAGGEQGRDPGRLPGQARLRKAQPNEARAASRGRRG
ncbi:hypothetical protein HMPREF1136_2007 [Actinomyces sp. ICM47]|nr:hypothetical protein HMPREF1136_2007 [Actinomyces sp. ICM47]